MSKTSGKKIIFLILLIILVALIVITGLSIIRKLADKNANNSGENATNISAETTTEAVTTTEFILPERLENDVKIPAIMYHNIKLLGGDDYCITPSLFKQDMQYLADNGYTTVFPSEIIDFVEKGTPLPEKPVLITIDDGYYAVSHYLLEYMVENDIKAVMNIVGAFTENAENSGEMNPNYSNMNWDEINKIIESGVFEIGNHSYDMHRLDIRQGAKPNPDESFEDYTSALNDDTMKLQNLFAEKCEISPTTYAYPYGFYTKDTVQILSDMGFKLLLTCEQKTNYVNIGDSEKLLYFGRCNRPFSKSVEEYMQHALKD